MPITLSKGGNILTLFDLGRIPISVWLSFSPLMLYLLDRIADNRKSIVCPMIDVIDHDNFGYETQAGDAMRGAFDWEMYYKRIPIPSELSKEDSSEPFE